MVACFRLWSSLLVVGIMPGIGVVFMVIVLFIISRFFIGGCVGCGMMPMDV